MSEGVCGVCGGDGRISNSSSSLNAKCPACHGSGRRIEGGGFRDVTKTKASHHRRQPGAERVVAKPTWPQTRDGDRLAKQVQENSIVSEETKVQLIRKILDAEASRGSLTQTFVKKIRKQLNPPTT